MKTFWTILATAIVLTACAHVSVREEELPDHVFKIVAAGDPLTPPGEVRERAYHRADEVCPRGYDKREEVPFDPHRPEYVLVIRCRW